MNVAVGRQTLLDNLFILPIEIFCLQSVFSGSLFAFSHNSGTWFISCLMICYVVFPLIQILLSNVSKKRIVTLLFGGIVLCIYAPFVADYFQTSDLYTNPFFRTVEFSVGILLAQVNVNFSNIGYSKYLKYFRGISALIISSIVLLFGVSIIHHYEIGNRCLVTVPCFSVIIMALGHLTLPRLLHSRAILYLSKISYAFFLSQFFVWYPLKYIMLHTGALSNLVLISITFTASICLSILLHEFVEKRCSQYLRIKLINHDIRYT